MYIIDRLVVYKSGTKEGVFMAVWKSILKGCGRTDILQCPH